MTRKKLAEGAGTTPGRVFAVDGSIPAFAMESRIASSPTSVRFAGAEPVRLFALSGLAARAYGRVEHHGAGVRALVANPVRRGLATLRRMG